MKRATMAGAAIAMVGMLLTGMRVQADATSDARKAISAAYAKEVAALKRKDAAGALGANAPDYSITQNGQTFTGAQMRQQMTMLLQQTQSISASYTIQKFVLKGKEAVCSIKEHVVLSAVDPRSHKKMGMTVDGTAQDTWTQIGKNWLRKRTVVTGQKQSMTVDGKPINMPSGPGMGR